MCRIIGIDPGLANTGFGIIDESNGKIRLVSYGVIETSANEEHAFRLLKIHEGILRVIEEFSPNESAMEDLYFGKNASSAIVVAEAKGVATFTLASRALAPKIYRPNEIKKSVTGTQNSPKETVEQYVALLLGLSKKPKPDHAADALAVAITHINSKKGKSAIKTVK